MAHKISQAARRLSIACPVIQGPFGGGLSSAALVAAVSNRGGLGAFGVHHLGAPEIAKVARDIRALTDKPFAPNLQHRSASDLMEALLEDFD